METFGTFIKRKASPSAMGDMSFCRSMGEYL